jgi:hypothetical protein
MNALLSQSTCRGAVVLDHYYALCCQSDAGKLYNHTVWVCDLRKINEVEDGFADTVWYPWNIDSEYMLQTSTGLTLGFDNKNNRIFSYSLSYKNDENFDGSFSNITAIWRTKDLFGDSLFVYKRPLMLIPKGKQDNVMTVYPYYFSDNLAASVSTTVNQPRALFIMGQSTMGSRVTQLNRLPEVALPSECVGDTFSFKFSKTGVDNHFEFIGFEFTYQAFQRHQG